MTFAVNSTFDVAFWFADQALNENEYLQPQKLHRLLYLAQAYYTLSYDGEKLMPAIFVANDLGPVEPTIYQAFTRGRPNVEVELFLTPEIEIFLNSIWRRFGHLKAEQLSKLTNSNQAYALAFRKSPGTEIVLEAMVTAFKVENETKTIDPSVAKQFAGDRIMRTQEGIPVKVQSWVPGGKSKT